MKNKTGQNHSKYEFFLKKPWWFDDSAKILVEHLSKFHVNGPIELVFRNEHNTEIKEVKFSSKKHYVKRVYDIFQRV